MIFASLVLDPQKPRICIEGKFESFVENPTKWIFSFSGCQEFFPQRNISAIPRVVGDQVFAGLFSEQFNSTTTILLFHNLELCLVVGVDGKLYISKETIDVL